MRSLEWVCDQCQRRDKDSGEGEEPAYWIRVELFIGAVHNVAHFCPECALAFAKLYPGLADRATPPSMRRPAGHWSPYADEAGKKET